VSVRLLKPHDRIFLITAGSPRELGEMFLRPQEFYESPIVRGTYFTHETFRELYIQRFGRAGRFTYFTDYQGYNFPGEALLDWQKAFASKETIEEQKLFTVLGALPDQFYVIGALHRDKTTIDHELHHALFHLDRGYRERVTAELALWREVLEQTHVAAKLRTLSYDENVIADESAAYILFEENWLRNRGVKISRLRGLRAALWVFFSSAKHRHIKPRNEW
jgi:hypothetical protein